MKLEKKIKGEQSLVAMLGINDENLRFLKKQFPKTKINVRGDAFYLDGDEPAYVDMPIWYTHNIKNIGDDVLYTNFWINEAYNAEDADTYFIEV